MSIHALEQALFDIAAGPTKTAAYRADPEGFLAGYRLEAEEIRMILGMDVRAMIERSINPMLAMRAFTAVEGRQNLGEYMRRIQAAKL